MKKGDKLILGDGCDGDAGGGGVDMGGGGDRRMDPSGQLHILPSSSYHSGTMADVGSDGVRPPRRISSL